MAELRTSGLALIREYIPDLPEYNPEDEPGQYNIPYVPQSQPPEVPDYQPSAITNVPELEEEEVHVKFADPPASPPPTGDVLMETTPGIPSIQGQLSSPYFSLDMNHSCFCYLSAVAFALLLVAVVVV